MSRFVSTFKLDGRRWRVRTYKSNGVKKYCYVPDRGYDPIFTSSPLTNEELRELCRKQDVQVKKAIARYKEKQLKTQCCSSTDLKAKS